MRAALSILGAALSLGLSGCVIGTPYRGGPLTETEMPSSVLVAVTHAYLGDDRAARRQFWKEVWAVDDIMADQPGYVGSRLRRSLSGKEVWTLTAWTDEESLMAFVRSPVHSSALNTSIDVLTALETTRFSIRTSDLPPTWKQAEQELKARPNQRSFPVRSTVGDAE